MFLHIVEAHYIQDFSVEVTFNDGRKGIADLSDALTGPIFEPLRDPAMFSKFWVDEELETIVWPNGADLAPEFIYFQAFKHEKELLPKFEAWGYVDIQAIGLSHPGGQTALSFAHVERGMNWLR
ncbi:MAG: DUF2442 domain-containing protein [Candidatus Methylumidiphilus sp.]